MHRQIAVLWRQQRDHLRIDFEPRFRAADALNPAIPPGLEDIIHRALKKDPSLRYQHAAEIQADLRRVERATGTGLSAVAETGRRGAKRWIALSVVLAVVLIAGLYERARRQRNYLGEKDTVVVADFDNSTGDPVFDDTLKTALNVSLRQSPYLSVLPDQRVAETLRLMTLSAATRLTPAPLVKFACGRRARPILPARSAIWARNMCWV